MKSMSQVRNRTVVIFVGFLLIGFSGGAFAQGTAVDDSVWVISRGPETVSRISKTAGAVTATIPVGSIPSGVAVDTDSVWVTNHGSGTVSRINKATLAVTTIPVGSFLGGVAVDTDSVWVAHHNSHAFSRINKATLAVTTIPVGSFPIGVAVDTDSVWVANSGSDTVSRISRTAGAVTATIPLPVGSSPSGVAVDTDSVWVTNLGSHTVSRINKAILTVTTIPVGLNPAGGAVDTDSVWVANYGSDTVSRINKATFTVTATIPVGSVPYSFGDMTGFAYDFFFTEAPNQPPIANAGADQTVDATSPAGASVTLDGTGSSDPDLDSLTFSWLGPFGTAVGATPTVLLPVGMHIISLTVADPSSATSFDTVAVTVRSPAEMTSNITTAVTVLEFQQAVKLLGNIASQINAGNLEAGCNQLNAFINQAQAQSGKQLTVDEANQLIASANQIRAALGCP